MSINFEIHTTFLFTKQQISNTKQNTQNHCVLMYLFLFKIKVSSNLQNSIKYMNKCVNNTIFGTRQLSCKYRYSHEIETCINHQIQAEHQAALNYMNIAVYFLNPHVSRPGAGGFFMNMFEEEIGHMKDFIQYQLSRGGSVVMNGLSTPENPAELSLLEAFALGLELERNITVMLEKIILLAEQEKDHRTADYITSVFMEEQMRSLQEMMQHVTKLSRLRDEHSLYHYDLNLLKNHPYSFKAK